MSLPNLSFGYCTVLLENDKNNSCHSIYFSTDTFIGKGWTHAATLTWHESYFASSFVFFQLTIIQNSIDWKNMLPDIRVHYTFEKIWIWNKINHFCMGSMSISASTKSPTQKSFKWEHSTIFKIEPNRWPNIYKWSVFEGSDQPTSVVLLEFCT